MTMTMTMITRSVGFLCTHCSDLPSVPELLTGDLLAPCRNYWSMCTCTDLVALYVLCMVCCVLYAVCCMLYVVCCMLYVVCCVWCIVYCVLCVACCVFHVSFSELHHAYTEGRKRRISVDGSIERVDCRQKCSLRGRYSPVETSTSQSPLTCMA